MLTHLGCAGDALIGATLDGLARGRPLLDATRLGVVAATLTLGYQGAVEALKKMGALDMGLKEEELPALVKTWRAANPAIKQFWYDVEDAVRNAIHPLRQ